MPTNSVFRGRTCLLPTIFAIRMTSRRSLIVGGRNSAVEAALRCWRAGAQVTLSYRRARFDERRVKHWLLPDIEAQIEADIRYLPDTIPVDREVVIWHQRYERRSDGELIGHETDFVLWRPVSVEIRGSWRWQGLNCKVGVRRTVFDPDTMETNLPGAISGRHGRGRDPAALYALHRKRARARRKDRHGSHRRLAGQTRLDPWAQLHTAAGTHQVPDEGLRHD